VLKEKHLKLRAVPGDPPAKERRFQPAHDVLGWRMAERTAQDPLLAAMCSTWHLPWTTMSIPTSAECSLTCGLCAGRAGGCSCGRGGDIMTLKTCFARPGSPLLHPRQRPIYLVESDQKTLLKPQIERWIHDQVKHDWADMWRYRIRLRVKKRTTLGQKDAPDLDRIEYVQAMQETIGVGYPTIEAFTLRAVEVKDDGKVLRISGCARERREEWKKTGLIYVRAKVTDGKALFELPR